MGNLTPNRRQVRRRHGGIRSVETRRNAPHRLVRGHENRSEICGAEGSAKTGCLESQEDRSALITAVMTGRIQDRTLPEDKAQLPHAISSL